jgi:hypothetical protein
MPIFAFSWLFHNKKRYYFDHGIFTLHYFSFCYYSFVAVPKQGLTPFSESSLVSFIQIPINFIGIDGCFIISIRRTVVFMGKLRYLLYKCSLLFLSISY